MIVIRLAAPEDAAAIASLVIRSISKLCVDDHKGDRTRIGAWTANKTPKTVEGWIRGVDVISLEARIEGRLAGFTAAAQEMILLNYVEPDFRFSGVSNAMLNAIEAKMAVSGVDVAEVRTTATARRFYLARGWAPIDAKSPDRLTKRLPR